MRDVIVGILLFLFALSIAALAALVIYSTPDKVCQQWEIVPKVFPW